MQPSQINIRWGEAHFFLSYKRKYEIKDIALIVTLSTISYIMCIIFSGWFYDRWGHFAFVEETTVVSLNRDDA